MDILRESDGVAPTHPPTPPSVLQVGMIGHRTLPRQDPLVLRRTIDEVLAHIAAPACGHVELRAVCALAAGADLLLAAAALAHGYALLAPLPFPREIYREDLQDDDARRGYDEILARAARIYELNGDREAGDAYQAVGRLLLEQSDLLVAVWDGEREKGIGGTGQIVREALTAGIPVIVIASAAPHSVRVLQRSSRPNQLVEAVVESMLKVDSAVLEGRRRYRNEDLGRRVRVPRLREAIEHVLLGLPGRRRRRVQRPQRHDPPALEEALGQIDAVLRPQFKAADELAIRYGALYRLLSTLRFLALLPATVATFFAFYGSNMTSRLGFLVLVIVTLGTLLIWLLDRRTGWHRRFLDYRLLAEHLRHARLLAIFGSTAVLPRTPVHLGSAHTDWVDREIRTSVRALGLIQFRFDNAAINAVLPMLRHEISTQALFFTERARRFGRLSRVLRHLGYGFFAAGLVLATARGLLAVFGVTGAALSLTAELALVTQSLVPVFFGFRSQNEYERLSQRYRSMARELRSTLLDLGRVERSRAPVERVARRFTSMMLAEVSDWQILIKVRDLDPV